MCLDVLDFMTQFDNRLLSARFLHGVPILPRLACSVIFDNIGFVKKTNKGGYHNWTLIKRHQVSYKL